MEYPKKITIKNPNLKKLLEEKGKFIRMGIAKSKEMEEAEKEMEEIDKKIQEFEATVNIDDLHEKEKEVTADVEDAIVKMDVIKREIYERMKKNTPQELYTHYDELVKLKEKAESDRNKLAIKAQKYNERMIPLSKQIMSPYLENEYDDFNTIKLEDGVVVAEVFNHLDEWKTNFKNKQI